MTVAAPTACKWTCDRCGVSVSQIDGTPTLIVAGRYRVTADSRDKQLATARWLVDREIAKAKRR